MEQRTITRRTDDKVNQRVKEMLEIAIREQILPMVQRIESDGRQTRAVAEGARNDLTTHEKVCLERQGTIIKSLERIEKIGIGVTAAILLVMLETAFKILFK